MMVLNGPDFAVRAAPHEGRPVLGKEGEEQYGGKEVSGRKEDEGEPDRDEGKVPGGPGEMFLDMMGVPMDYLIYILILSREGGQ